MTWSESDLIAWMYIFVVVILVVGGVVVYFMAPPMPKPGSGPRMTKTTARANQASSTFNAIPDQYSTVEEVKKALRQAGLETSELIVAIDFTKSNTWTGEQSFGGRSLHNLEEAETNPYQTVLGSLGRTLSDMDEDDDIPAYGFGDLTTKDHSVFPFKPDGEPCQGLKEVLDRYKHHAATVRMSGPTSFAPAIREALRIIQTSGGYHILVIVADGQVTDEQETTEAIVEASRYPLSIIVVGVGDGPWETMQEFDDALPAREFDNFQFVPFEKVRASCPAEKFDATLALACLQELPDQYKALRAQGKLRRGGKKADADAKPTAEASVAEEEGAEAMIRLRGSQASVAGDGEAPENYFCPITQETMTDPVMAEDGYTYERLAIERWFEQKSRSQGGLWGSGGNQTAPSPMGNHAISKKLIPNNALRSEIMEWRERNPGA